MAKRYNNSLILGTVLALVLKTSPLYAELSSYQNADYVVGQSTMTNGTEGTTAYNLHGPQSVYSDGAKLYVAESYNNRVLIYNTIPTSNNATADVVIGQSSMTYSGSGTTAYKLKYPTCVYSYGGKLYVTDMSNNRILIYDPIPTSDNASASIVLGPDAMTADGIGVTSFVTNSPVSVYVHGTKLYVVDYYNNRVLIYDPIPTSNGASASIVVGQSDMVTGTTGTTAYKFHNPSSAYVSGTKLYVADENNSRILIYDPIPTSNNASASIVVGQSDMVTGTTAGGVTAYQLDRPSSIYSDGGKFYVADPYNHRVLIYNEPLPSSNASASLVVGQADMTTELMGTAAYNFNYPSSAYVSGTKLYVADENNSRILIYDPIPTSNNASASIVVGQADMTTVVSDTKAYRLNSPSSVYVSGTKLYVADKYNNRVLIYDPVPTSNNASANTVTGPDPMTADWPATSAYGLNSPVSVYAHGTKLYVSDRDNNRLLIYDPIPTSNLASASVVVGQANMTSDTSDTKAYRLHGPYGISTDGTKLYVVDAYSNRVLIYNTIPTSNNAPASVVVGQTNMTSATGGLTSYKLTTPASVYSNGTRLYVSEGSGGNRVLIYNSIPTSDNASADVILGKYAYDMPPTASSPYMPTSAYVSKTKLYVADYGNNRVLIYNEAVGKTMTIEGNVTIEGAVTAE